MNLSTCFLVQYFQSLSVMGKVAVIAGYILMALLLILWEKSRTRRHAATGLPTVIPTFNIEETQKFIHTIPTSASKDNQYKPHKRPRHLLETFRSNLSKSIVYCKSRTDSKNPAYHLQQDIPKHIRTIVNRLTRIVNQSGKEPMDDQVDNSGP
jgi:hypothetical protein